MDKLLIIESPNKIKTLTKYLDNKYSIIATIGHIRDLSSFAMGFDKETFEPKWVIPTHLKGIKNEKSKKEIIEEIKKEAKKASEIYLATDPDREGEAIAWHVYEILPEEDKKKCKRISFNEITKNAIVESFDNKRDINLTWVQSQFARRLIDRIIGFKLSKLMQIKLKAESAGRVQSVALKCIEDREKEIALFVAENWWTIDVVLKDKNQLIFKTVSPKLTDVKLTEKSYSVGVNLVDEKSANAVIKSLDKDGFIVKEILEPTFFHSSPKPPYKTSTLQQDAINKLNWSSRKITSVAQKLYEGIEIDGNQIALISYPRTDSIRLSESFISTCKTFIETHYGANYFGGYKTAVKVDKNVQDAHEAIRVIDPTITPASLSTKLSKDDWALYNLVWIRTVASLMTQAKFKKITVNIENNGNEFYTFSKVCEFDGFLKIVKIDGEDDEEKIIDINDYKIDSKLSSQTIESKPHETAPPAKFTQASLIADLEKAGVGRPSTYSSMANVVLDRGYADLDKKSFVMTEVGKIVIEALEKYFPNIINKNFTKEMEEHLDKIAHGEEEWKKWLREFFPSFSEEVNLAYESMEKVEDKKVGRLCPDCNHELVIKHAKKGGSKFIGCSNYPECKHLEPLEKPQILPDKCPECQSDLLMRKSKRGSFFVGCSSWPKCTYILSDKQYKDISSKPDYKMPSKNELDEMRKNRFAKKETKALSTFDKEKK
ncbi:MAG: type I DNA topoisomerase [Malacoplasma sp.]